VILYYFLKCTYFFVKYLWKEKQIVNCVNRNNTNFNANIKQSDMADFKMKICDFILILKVHLFLSYVPLKQKNIVNCVRR